MAAPITKYADVLSAYGVPYQLYDDPGLYTKDDAYVRPGTFDSQIPVWDGQRFKLVNNKGKTVLYEGAGIDGLREASRLSKDLGSGWAIYTNSPDALPDSGAINSMFDQRDGGSVAGMTYAGRSKSDFDPAFLVGALPFLAAVAAPAIGGALGGGGGAGAGAGIGGSSLGGAAASGAASSLGGLAAGGAGLSAAALPAFEGITVVGAPAAAGAGAAGAAAGLAGAAGAAAGLGGGSTASAPFDGITVTGAPPPGIDPSFLAGLDFGGLSAMQTLPGGGSPSPATEVVDPETITVEGTPQTPPPLDLGLPIDLAALGVAGAAPLAGGAGPVTSPEAAAPKSTLDKIVDYLQLGALGTGLLGNLFGGGGGSGSGNGKVPPGLGSDLGPIFSGGLPTNPTIPGVGTADKLGARTMPAQDWTRYGMRPEQSFHNFVPSKYTPPAPGQRDEWDNLAVKGAY